MHVIASSTSSVLDQIFGKKLFSLHFVCISACFSFASIYLIDYFYVFIFLQIQRPVYGFLSTGYLILASVANYKENSKWTKLWFGIIIISIPFTIVILSIFAWTPESQHSPLALLFTLEFLLPSFMLAATIAVVCDLLFVALTRWILQLSFKSKSFFTIASMLFLNAFLALSLFLVPLYYRYTFERYMIPDGYTIEISHPYFFFRNLSIVFAYPLIVYSNLYTAIVAISFIILALLMLLHLVIWPVMERPIYVLQDLGIVRRKKLLVAVGISLIAIWFGHVPEFLKILEKLIP